MELKHHYSLVTSKFYLRPNEKVDLLETFKTLKSKGIEVEYDPENGFNRIDFVLNECYRFQVFANGSVIVNCKGKMQYNPRELQGLLDRVFREYVKKTVKV